MKRGITQKCAVVSSDQEVRFLPKPCKGLAGVLVGSLITIAGVLLITFPISAIFVHPAYGDDDSGPVYLERVTRESSRVYGVVALILGPCLIWFARWPRWGRRNAAIEDYIWGLSQELDRRFGPRNVYTIEEVSKVVRIGGYRQEFVAHAHAIFCSRCDFDEEYKFKKEKVGYCELREVVARRYFARAHEFDAESVVRMARPPRQEENDCADLSSNWG